MNLDGQESNGVQGKRLREELTLVEGKVLLMWCWIGLQLTNQMHSSRENGHFLRIYTHFPVRNN